MRTLGCTVIILLISATVRGQQSKFKTYNNSTFVISCFQADIIDLHPDRSQFVTEYPNNDGQNPILVYENIKQNEETPEGYGDPLCIWVNRERIDSIDNIKWLKIEELFLEKKWIYLTLTVMSKHKETITEIYSFQYKVKADRYSSKSGGKTNFKKIKTTSNLP